MPKTKRTSEEPRRGDRLNERTLRRYLRGANESNDGVQGPGTRGLVEPCFIANVVNSDTVAIQAFHAMSLDRSVEITSPALFTSRSFQARTIVNSTLAPPHAAIALDRIPVGSAGRAYVSGVCAAKLSDNDAALVVSGGGTILWTETALDTLNERWAIVRIGGQPAGPAYVQIILGQTVSAVPMVQYAADPLTLTTYFDPDTDTTLDAGLGVGMLYDALGHQYRRVLVRHNYRGFTDPVMAGVTYMVGGPTLLTVTVSDDPPDTPVTGKKYTVGQSPSGAWAGQAGKTATWNGSSWTFTAAPTALSMYAYPLIRG